MPQHNYDSENTIDYETSTEEEISEWIVLTRKVLIVLEEEDKNAYNKVYINFTRDLQGLKDAGKITDSDYEETQGNL